MKKWIALVSLVAAAVIVLSGCSKDESSVKATGETKEFTINAKNFEFDQRELKVKQGDEVKITLNNAEGNHTIKVDGYDEEVQGDQTVTFVADEKGEFKFVCGIFCGEGHGEMIGKLIVE